jgi:hypothetical protein
MTIKQSIEKNGERETAYRVLNRRIMMVCGLGLSDLPDVPELADIVDEIEDIISDDVVDTDALREVLSEVTMEFIEEVCW